MSTPIETNTEELREILNAVNELPSTDELLNLKVVAYATEDLLNADTPNENTIGVITTTPIPGWHFAAEQPEDMTEGNVWFPTGVSSNVAFNALKKNTVKVYLVAAKQYVNGSYNTVTAKTFQNGKWVELWDGMLYEYGNEYDDITGGWVAENYFGIFNVEKYSDHIYCTAKETSSSGGGGCVRTKNKIPIKHSTLTILYDATRIASDTVLCLADTEDLSDPVCEVTLSKGTEITDQLDISEISGPYYVGIRQYTNNGSTTLTIYRLELT